MGWLSEYGFPHTLISYHVCDVWPPAVLLIPFHFPAVWAGVGVFGFSSIPLSVVCFRIYPSPEAVPSSINVIYILAPGLLIVLLSWSYFLVKMWGQIERQLVVKGGKLRILNVIYQRLYLLFLLTAAEGD